MIFSGRKEMNISTLDIDELGRGRIRHYLEGEQWSASQIEKMNKRNCETHFNKIIAPIKWMTKEEIRGIYET
jgi:hypothetical protein